MGPTVPGGEGGVPIPQADPPPPTDRSSEPGRSSAARTRHSGACLPGPRPTAEPSRPRPTSEPRPPLIGAPGDHRTRHRRGGLRLLRHRIRPAGRRHPAVGARGGGRPRCRGGCDRARRAEPLLDRQGGGDLGVHRRHRARPDRLRAGRAGGPAAAAVPLPDHHQRQPGDHRPAQHQAARAAAQAAGVDLDRRAVRGAGDAGRRRRAGGRAPRRDVLPLGAADRLGGADRRRQPDRAPARPERGDRGGSALRPRLRRAGRRRTDPERRRPLRPGAAARRPGAVRDPGRRHRRDVPAHGGPAGRLGERRDGGPGGRRDRGARDRRCGVAGRHLARGPRLAGRVRLRARGGERGGVAYFGQSEAEEHGAQPKLPERAGL